MPPPETSFLVSLEECCNASPVYDGGVSSTSVSPRMTQATPEAENVCGNVAVTLPFVISVGCDGQAQSLACASANSSSHRCYYYTTLQYVPLRRVWGGVRYGCLGKNKSDQCEVLFNTGSEKFCQAVPSRVREPGGLSMMPSSLHQPTLCLVVHTVV